MERDQIIPNSPTVVRAIFRQFWTLLKKEKRKTASPVIRYAVLQKLAIVTLSNCLVSFLFCRLLFWILEWKGAFCGNKIVEEGEECDCGYDNEECDEKCCYPRVVSESDKLINPEAQGCKRRPSMFTISFQQYYAWKVNFQGCGVNLLGLKTVYFPSWKLIPIPSNRNWVQPQWRSML